MYERKLPRIRDIKGVTYDDFGRINYHPVLHFKKGKKFTNRELAYLCKFYNHDDRRTLSFALGRHEQTIDNKYRELQKQGLVDHYIQVWDSQFKG
ncbi:MAG: hypothetical protein ACFWT6_12075 [Virgibacillus proomii]